MSEDFKMNLQMFADAGTLVNTTQNYVNAYTGEGQEFDESFTLSPTMKVFYDKNLLNNARPKLRHVQLGRKDTLPANNGKTKEWRRIERLPKADVLVEGVIPPGKKMTMYAMTSSVTYHGMYVAITDELERHAVDNMLLAASDELGASASLSADTLVRDELMTGTNVMFCDTVDADGKKTQPTGWAEMSADNNRLTADMINKAQVLLKKKNAPEYDGGGFMALIHPSLSYDIRQSKGWLEPHQYAAPEEIFEGEIGKIHGVRFVESTEAKITTRTLSGDEGLVYSTFIMGKDAYAVIDPEGGGLRMIVKGKGEIGGPLEQFSTAGYKFGIAAKILYPDRIVRLESCSELAYQDSEN